MHNYTTLNYLQYCTHIKQLSFGVEKNITTMAVCTAKFAIHVEKYNIRICHVFSPSKFENNAEKCTHKIDFTTQSRT